MTGHFGFLHTKAAGHSTYDFSPGYINLPNGVGERIAFREPWPLAPYTSALWTVRFK